MRREMTSMYHEHWSGVESEARATDDDNSGDGRSTGAELKAES